MKVEEALISDMFILLILLNSSTNTYLSYSLLIICQVHPSGRIHLCSDTTFSISIIQSLSYIMATFLVICPDGGGAII